MEQRIDKYVLPNGMVVLGEPMPGVESVAFDFMLPAGAAWMPPGYGGAANVISEWIFRGAGTRDNRKLGDALDGLGLHRSSSDRQLAPLHRGRPGVEQSGAGAGAVLPISFSHPHLSDEQFEPARQLIIEELQCAGRRAAPEGLDRAEESGSIPTRWAAAQRASWRTCRA